MNAPDRRARSSRSPLVAVSFALIAALACSTGGCGRARPDFTAEFRGGSDIETGTPVYWKNQRVGEVMGVRAQAGRILAAARLDAGYRDAIFSNVKVKLVSNPATELQPRIELLGGTDSNRPPLRRGARITEAGVVDQAVIAVAEKWRELCDKVGVKVVAGAVVLIVLVFALALLSGGFRSLLIAVVAVLALLVALAILYQLGILDPLNLGGHGPPQGGGIPVRGP